ncbi:dihydroorotate dehydrogenase-like protein [Aeoliella mucimassa]|uniref:Dihydroorotate dehydrogenase B (NAD(+)), catalytic subunit n=1 Tax=Aeoliella mucimassa TaxID=2527972 RepID=A0A518AQ21_9BACT|nr:dihydroorotate dehydrogenase-like protein [Aeoliella mucimassa]QDU56821.1 Dihydroorotate dehydrogenase B (NAD(+)), catalytic subunit [Aeoliella mucimassa]
MAVDLKTQYLGLTLKNPLAVAACQPLTGDMEMLGKLEAAGASCVVMPSLFEEQVVHEELEISNLYDFHTDSNPEALTNLPPFPEYDKGSDEYLKRLEEAKKTLSIPVIGSLNGSSKGGWVRYAKEMQDAGADALELNIYFIPTDVNMTGDQVEGQYVDLVAAVRESVSIPLAVKIGQNFTSLPNFAQKLVGAGANGLVLFNRYLEADINLDELEFYPDLVLSNRHEARVPIRWISILRDQVSASLAATSGIHRMEGAIKLLLAGADVLMLASVLLMKGPNQLTTILNDMTAWLEQKEYVSVQQLQGSMSCANSSNPSELVRANYMKALRNYTTEYTSPH